MRVRPITRNAATPWIAANHRHLKRAVTGWLFGIEILDDDGNRVGVAIAGRPAARELQDGVTIEITRVATNGHRNACSLAYGSLRRAALALGYQRIITYTRADELGTACQGRRLPRRRTCRRRRSLSSLSSSCSLRRPNPQAPMGLACHALSTQPFERRGSGGCYLS